MITMPPRLMRVFQQAYTEMKEGRLKTLIPFLSLFRINGKPLTLNMHYQFAPLFNCVQPAKSMLMTGRQVGKSWGICESILTRSMIVPYYHTVLIQPRADQIQRMIGTIYKPIMNSCPMIDFFISSVERQKLALREFRNGSLCYAEHMFDSADRIRGIGNAATVVADETLREDEHILCVDLSRKTLFFKEISKIKRGDTIASFGRGDILCSVVERDASFHGIRQFYKITTETGRTVICTLDHCLPTNLGRMRLEDIIEYEAEHCRNYKDSNECNAGKPSGRRLDISSAEDDIGLHKMESQQQTAGICESEIWGVARVMQQGTRDQAERRIRRILGKLEYQISSGISLSVVCPSSGIHEDQDSYRRIFGDDRSSNSIGMVVHGRRIEGQGSQYRRNSNERILGERSRSSCELAEEQVGNRITQIESDPLVNREHKLHHLTACKGICGYDETYSTICSGIDEIQDRAHNVDMRGMRYPYPEEQENVLFTSLCMRDEQGNKEDICGAAPGSYKCKESSMGCGAQGADTGSCTCEISGNVEGGPREAYRTVTPLQKCAQGSDKHAQKRMESCTQGRSNLQGTEKEAGCAVLPESEAESGEIRGKTSKGQGLSAHGGRQGSREAVSAPSTCGEACPGSGSAGQVPGAHGASGGAGEHDTGTAQGVQAEAEPCKLSQAQGGTHSGRSRGQKDPDKGTPAEVHGGAEGGSGEICQVSGRRDQTQGSQESQETCTDNTAGNTAASHSEPMDRDGLLRWDRIVYIEPVGKARGYDIEVVGTHNYILANGICSYNCQDIEYEFLDIAAEVMSASLFWGFSVYTGTPKTTDTTLALLWNRSSQAEWVMHCEHCGHFNIPNPEHDLLKMIGKHGPICAHCGKPVSPAAGGYVHAIPERMHTFPGYHISQPIHPLHMLNQNKWNRLLDKFDTYTELVLYNEVLGWPYDAATSPLTLSDLQKASNPIDVNSVEDFEKIADRYSYVTVAVDWSGGGMLSDSYTAMAVLGLRRSSDVIDVIYGRRLPKGMSPTDEAREILAWIKGTGADAFAYDNGGAGFARLEIMNHEGLQENPGLIIVPINYVRPHSGDVMVQRPAQREPDMAYYTLDKSRSLAICIMALKAGRLRVPAFNESDDTAYQRDFLALREDPRVSLGNETVILIIKKPGVPDDFAHAVNFGASQIWDHFGAYPRIGTKYDASILDFDENHNKIMDDEVFGPRGDFDRFRNAVESRAASLLEPQDWFSDHEL